MKTFYSLLVNNLRRAILTWRFFVCSLGIMFVMIFSVWDWIINPAHYVDVIYLYSGGLSGGSQFLITGILPLFVFSTTFASEWEQKAISFWIIRTGIHKYTIVKVIITAISGFLTTIVGFLLFISLMKVRFKLFTHMSEGDAYASLLENGESVKYLAFHMMHISLTSLLFAVIALLVSTYIPNPFVAITSPLIIYFMSHRLTTMLSIPDYLKTFWFVESIYDAGSPLSTLLLKLTIVLFICLVVGLATVLQVRRRVFRA